MDHSRISSRGTCSWLLLSSLLLLLVANTFGLEVCDTYSVQLQATFPDNTLTPCSSQETSIIEALLHSLVQTDVLVGLDGLPIHNFFLAFEKLGADAKWANGDTPVATDSQYDQAFPHMTEKDVLEDIFDPSVSPSISPSESPSAIPSESPTDSLDEDDRNGLGANVSTAVLEKVNGEDGKPDGPLPEIDLFDDSLRSGAGLTTAYDKTGSGARKLGDSCAADWCAFFITKPCQAIPQDPLLASKPIVYHAMMTAFQERVAEAIEKKLRKWARDTDTLCLGNSWELKAIVSRLG
ncbi:expressed unknown protein [Seminavis robusta]|uniref:Uncharacterized protein n=1 Tax=Seminavis robusta TaxID=568900 RepID=A0A9N8HD36_9STRA|nr:expressed unknown protein [Seminavis robusta]|eukprot:Sro326_g118190.1 n/a (294) ;mRNA; r:54184-55293